MNVMIDICIVPIGVGVSLSDYIVECQKIFEDDGLSYQLHGYGTNVEGEWDQVMKSVKKCHEKLHFMGAPRITSSMRLGTRTDCDQSIKDKISSVKEKLN